MIATIKLIFLLFASPTDNVDKICTVYELLRCEETEITSAIILYESGHLQAYKLKKDNAQKHGNLCGFFYKKSYLTFDSYASGIRYYQRFQKKRWGAYKRKYPDQSYYNFLRDLPYCIDMDKYLRAIKQLQK